MYLPPLLPSIAVPASEQFCLPPTPISLRFLPDPLREARALQKPPLPRRLLPSMLLPRRALHREPISPGLLIRPRSPLRRLATRCIRLPCRLRVASSLGRTVAPTGTAPPTVHHGFGPHETPRPSARRANTPQRAPRPWIPLVAAKPPAPAPSPVPTVLIPSGGDRADPVKTPLSILPSPRASRPPQ